MEVEMSEMVECRYHYSTCIWKLRIDLSECLSVIFESSGELLASVVQLVKKRMELYELGVAFLFKGVCVFVCACVCNLIMFCCLHLGSVFSKAI